MFMDKIIDIEQEKQEMQALIQSISETLKKKPQEDSLSRDSSSPGKQLERSGSKLSNKILESASWNKILLPEVEEDSETKHQTKTEDWPNLGSNLKTIKSRNASLSLSHALPASSVNTNSPDRIMRIYKNQNQFPRIPLKAPQASQSK